MPNCKSIGLPVIIAACCLFSTAANAQTSSEILKIENTASSPVTSTENETAAPLAPKRYKVKRVVEPVPVRATGLSAPVTNAYGRKVLVNQIDKTDLSRFVYKTEPKKTQTPVYFSAESLKSK